MSARLVLSVLALVFPLEAGTRFGESAPPTGAVDVEAAVPRSFIEQWADTLATHRAHQDAVTAARIAVGGGVEASVAYASLPRDHALLDRALDRIRTGHPGDGLALLETYLEIPQPVAAERVARDAAARAALLVGQPADTLRHLDATVPEPDTLDGYRALWRAKAALSLGHFEDAVGSARVARDFDPHSPIVHEARFLAAEALLGVAGSEAEGVSQLETLLGRYPEYPDYDRIQVAMADAERRAGALTAAARRLDALVWARPFSGRALEAVAALEALVADGAQLAPRSMEERLARGRELRLLRHWDAARDALLPLHEDAVAAGARTTFLNEVRLQLSLNAYDSARFEDALRWMDAIDESGGAGVSSYNRATWRARPLSRLDREEEAYEVLADYYANRSHSERHDRLFEFASDCGMWSVALEHLEARYSRDRDWESWNGAFTHYMAGNHDRARVLFATLARRASGQTRARYQYWQARSLEHLGEVGEAMALYHEIEDAHPYRYYGLQAHNRVLEWESVGATADMPPPETPLEPPTPRPGRVHWDGFDGEPAAGFGALRVDDLDVFFQGYPDELMEEDALSRLADTWGDTFPEVVTADALWRVGAVEEARKVFRGPLIEFRALDSLARQGRRVRGDRPIRLSHRRWAHYIDNRPNERGWWGIELDALRFPVPSGGSARRIYAARQSHIQSERAVLRPEIRAVARQLGDFYMVRRFALDDDLPSISDEPMDVRWHEAYPRAYGPQLWESIDRYQLNPFIVWALMIVESDMNPDTISHADAYGLLQVIPKTGDLVAMAFGEVDFGVHDLLETSESMRYGTWYLDQLLTKFHGQEMLAMVAYNAGPHQVQRWLEWRGESMDMDEFIETVPYDGARRYPQRIVQYLSILRAVNGRERRVYIGNALDAEFEDNIYF